MKRHIGILAVGIALSAGAVSAELHRSAVANSVPSIAVAPAAAQQSLLKQPITNASKISITATRPTIKGAGGGENEGESEGTAD